MNKLNAKELKEELLEKELSFIDLDNLMSSYGYYSVMDDGATADIKESGSVVYTALDTQECEVIVEFTITIDSSKEEVSESFYLKVNNVTEF